ncbi:metallo-beta-lactamase domain-containing protein 1 [Bradysia coprophila]|uniref:metallo-beta-lactamase domain-containing protein 1 n=1 Tax=Bradysia coprophila TaxID=38358 RepID=UPI00187DB062|nr:metallo-beta-lactamase domain-containing protein 1 [Bradysia coprophila]
MSTKNVVTCLFEGYCVLEAEKNRMLANCTCTLVRTRSGNNILVDTMTPWDRDKLLQALANVNLLPENISHLINTHGHSDHIGNNNLFLQAKHIVGQNVSFKDQYELHDFKDPYVIEDGIEVVATKGHTLGCVSLIVRNGICNGIDGVIGIVGDLFERYDDIDDDTVWMDAGSEDPIAQRHSRCAVADIADYILPGHGAGFVVTECIRSKLRSQFSMD